MKGYERIAALSLLMGTLGVASAQSAEPIRQDPPDSRSAPTNSYNGRQDRGEVFEFAQKPAVAKAGDKWLITFGAKAACDATVAIINKEGKVVRHLASGVLGKNSPDPFQQDSLTQKLEWDGKDDDGQLAPAGCTVKIGLGLDARFEKIETSALLAGLRVVAVGKEGEAYATAHSYEITGTLQAFGKDGKFLRTILPPPGVVDGQKKITPERFASIAWNKTTTGDWVPRLNRGGGGFNFELTKLHRFFSGTVKSGALTADGKLCLLYAPDRRGDSYLLLVDARDGSCAEEDIINLGDLVADGLTVSPDGTWLYFAGRQTDAQDKGLPVSHSVMRMSLSKPGKAELFLGELATAGSDDAHFSGPNRVACDKDGNLYVNDSGNRRIQVFQPDGRLLKTIPEVTGLFGVSHKTGAIYLWNQITWQKNPIVTKLGGLKSPAKIAEMEISCGGEWREGQQSAYLAEQADPPIIWFSGQSYRGNPYAVGIEDRGDSLVEKFDLMKANNIAPSNSYLVSPGMWRSLHVDRRTDEWLWDHPVGPDGLRYMRSQYFSAPQGMPDNKMWVIRYDPKTKDYVSFAHGEPAGAPDPIGEFGGSIDPLTQNGKPVIGLPMFLSRGSHLHQGPFCVAPNGDIYVGASYSKEADVELEKAGLPRLQPKGLATVCALVLRVYSPDGKLKSACALPGLAELEGLRVGRSGAVYVVQPWKPLGQKLPDGLAEGGDYEPTRWGSLIKFSGDFKTFPVGRIEGAWEATPAEPTHQTDQYKVKITGALWTYGGVSPHSGEFTSCTCLKASADLDDYERSFVCAAQSCTVNVIDSNGNLMARLGGYGILDQGLVTDPETTEARLRRLVDLKGSAKPLAFSLPRNVAASDNAMWVSDLNQRALVKAALIYHAEESVPLP